MSCHAMSSRSYTRIYIILMLCHVQGEKIQLSLPGLFPLGDVGERMRSAEHDGMSVSETSTTISLKRSGKLKGASVLDRA